MDWGSKRVYRKKHGCCSKQWPIVLTISPVILFQVSREVMIGREAVHSVSLVNQKKKINKIMGFFSTLFYLTSRLTADLHLFPHLLQIQSPSLISSSTGDHQLRPYCPFCPITCGTMQKFFNLPPHSSHCPSPQLQQAFPGNLSAMPAREAHRPAKQVGELQIFTLPPLLQILPPLTPQSHPWFLHPWNEDKAVYQRLESQSYQTQRSWYQLTITVNNNQYSMSWLKPSKCTTAGPEKFNIAEAWDKDLR